MTFPEPRRLLATLPDGPRSIAYEAWRYILQSDPVLGGVGDDAGVVKTWMCRTGQPRDAQEPAEGLCPIVGLSPVPRDDRNETGRTRVISMEVAVEVFTRAGCVLDQLNLWDAVQAACEVDRALPDGQTVGQYLRCQLPALANGDRVSISDFEFRRPAITAYLPSNARPGADTLGMTGGAGSIAFKFQARR